MARASASNILVLLAMVHVIFLARNNSASYRVFHVVASLRLP